MTPASALAALSPERRAALIYGAAQAELSDRLWKAALGPEASDTSARGGTTADFRDRDSQLTALMNLLSLEATRNGIAAPSPAPPPAQLPGVPSHASPIGTVSSRMTAAQGDTRDAIVDAAPCSFGANARYRDCVDAAAARTGLPAAALAAIVDAEAAKASDGSWQTYSRNPRSSAAGLGQFLTRTWQGLAETPGTWLNRQAEAQGWLAGGRVQAHARGALLALRYDPTAAINGVADYARRNLDGLKRAGVTADDTRGVARLAYLGHHLGLGDAIRFVRDGGLAGAHAKTLLDAQIGSAASSRKIAQAGNATEAHRDWMLVYLDRRVRPEDFSTAPRQSIG